MILLIQHCDSLDLHGHKPGAGFVRFDAHAPDLSETLPEPYSSPSAASPLPSAHPCSRCGLDLLLQQRAAGMPLCPHPQQPWPGHSLMRVTAAAPRHSLLSMLPRVLLQARQQDKAELICPPPAVWKPVPLWTGKQVSSRIKVCLGLTLNSETSASEHPAISLPSSCPPAESQGCNADQHMLDGQGDRAGHCRTAS